MMKEEKGRIIFAKNKVTEGDLKKKKKDNNGWNKINLRYRIFIEIAPNGTLRQANLKYIVGYGVLGMVKVCLRLKNSKKISIKLKNK